MLWNHLIHWKCFAWSSFDFIKTAQYIHLHNCIFDPDVNSNNDTIWNRMSELLLIVAQYLSADCVVLLITNLIYSWSLNERIFLFRQFCKCSDFHSKVLQTNSSNIATNYSSVYVNLSNGYFSFAGLEQLHQLQLNYLRRETPYLSTSFSFSNFVSASWSGYRSTFILHSN